MRNILYTAQLGLNHPIAIRYPRGRGITVDWQKPFEVIEIGTGKCLKHGTKTAVISSGTIGNNVVEAFSKIENTDAFAHYDFAFVKPLDEKLLHLIFNTYQSILTIEDGTIKGGFGSAIVEFSKEHSYATSIKTLGIPDQFIEHGSIAELQKICGIDVESLISVLKNE